MCHARCRVGWLLLLGCLISGCTGVTRPTIAAGYSNDGPGYAKRAGSQLLEPVRNLPKSRSGNAPLYTVFGKSYQVMDSAEGFTESGLASWYGAKFHGRPTSSGERYDMYTLTAAHKHLPLPTFVRVTHQSSGKSIIVKVNDRGPFIGDRIIDLSYAAALQLDMIGSGTAPVSIEALSTHHVADADTPAKPVPLAEADPAGNLTAAARSESVDGTAASAQPAVTVAAGAPQQFIQLGAFSQQPNADSLLDRIAGAVPLPIRVQHDDSSLLYRVQLGPVATQSELNDTIVALSAVGIEDYTLVSDE